MSDRDAWQHLYHSPGYRRRRALFLMHNPLCSMCARPTPATVLDHIIPHKGDERLFLDESNWQALCADCHDAIKQAQEHVSHYTTKGDDGWPID